MGRWAQRSRAGGSTQTIIAQMIRAQLTGPTEVRIEYNTPVGAGTLIPGDFESQGTGATGTVAVQITPTRIGLDLSDDATGDPGIIYSGDRVATLTPQTIAYT